MAIAVALILLLAASVLFYFLSPWQLLPLASNWKAIDTTISISFWVCGFVFVAVVLFMVWSILRYRYDERRRSGYDPENKKLEAWLTGLTTVGIAALLAPGLIVWADFVTVPEDAHRVAVVGSQWHWQFRYPGEDGELGAVHVRHTGPGNPLGIDPEDPAGQDDIVIDEPVLRLPVGLPVELVMTSRDVIHNFNMPHFRTKMDVLPGQMSYFWFTPADVGEWQAICAELCGIGHYAMASTIRVLEVSEFDEWLARQPTFAQLQALDPGDPESGRAVYARCTACHGDRGQGNPATNAPAIAGMEPWYLRRQLQLFKEGARGTAPDDQYGAQMKPFADMLDRQQMRDVAAWVHGLEGSAGSATISGDEQRGRRLYRTCGNCHGADGEGHRIRNAPRLAGTSDWYVARQIRNFRDGIRGRHPQDPYGSQMIGMVQYLNDEEDVHDVVSYINTLGAAATGSGSTSAGGE
ncbi:MAG: c-type cytochrome [Wenzhouxiangellaceae bacterium]|nr:c-type cytochrome [Wenzhouxiangellaceae bacterium]